MNKKIIFISAIFFLQSISQNSWSAAGIGAKQCMQEAKGEIEITYCKILEKEGAAKLPNFYQFRLNPIQTQKLLLKSPARKAGIEIPEDIQASSQLPIKPTPVITAAPETKPETIVVKEEQDQSSKKDLPAMSFPASGSKAPSGLTDCTLEQIQIRCQKGIFQLQSNLGLQQLEPDVLGDDNRLEFPDRQNNETILQYLSRVYPSYIEKMLLLGLGDATMSFTKFNAMFHETVKQGLSFKRRFRDMYELLKKERKTQGIKARYNNLLPETIANCMRLNADIIACDNVKQNWLYTQN